ncbi:MAG: twin-arginine translocase TatA/TatE family subunit [Bdellovibrionota bacterium]|nr:twin-arginine translocase TatA/TatE family subunit [Bdellovibrionota bacterium]MEC8623209.1 twin-arginine translocase TatA/TatE family subunit [Bdellovibrionota bacterium]
MFGLGGGELLLVAFIALIFIGPKKLPELAKGLGKGIREFQKAKDDIVSEVVEDRPKVSENSPSSSKEEGQKPHKD